MSQLRIAASDEDTTTSAMLLSRAHYSTVSPKWTNRRLKTLSDTFGIRAASVDTAWLASVPPRQRNGPKLFTAPPNAASTTAMLLLGLGHSVQAAGEFLCAWYSDGLEVAVLPLGKHVVSGLSLAPDAYSKIAGCSGSKVMNARHTLQPLLHTPADVVVFLPATLPVCLLHVFVYCQTLSGTFVHKNKKMPGTGSSSSPCWCFELSNRLHPNVGCTQNASLHTPLVIIMFLVPPRLISLIVAHDE